MRDNSHPEILVVDDDAMSRRVLAQLLSAAGYNCRVSNDGSEALEAIHARPPSLLLLDFDMPGLNGAEVLRRLRSDEDSMVAQIPAIMLTAHGSEQSEVSCLQAGADDFVTKACQCIGVAGTNRDATSASFNAATSGAAK